MTTVTATNTGGLTFLATPNATSGVFALAGLVSGSYVLTFSPRTGFLVPNARTIGVTAGSTAPAGTVLVAPVPLDRVAGTIFPVDAVTRVELISSGGVTASAVGHLSAFARPGRALPDWTELKPGPFHHPRRF